MDSLKTPGTADAVTNAYMHPIHIQPQVQGEKEKGKKWQ
jgi:hypothetical protein